MMETGLDMISTFLTASGAGGKAVLSCKYILPIPPFHRQRLRSVEDTNTTTPLPYHSPHHHMPLISTPSPHHKPKTIKHIRTILPNPPTPHNQPRSVQSTPPLFLPLLSISIHPSISIHQQIAQRPPSPSSGSNSIIQAAFFFFLTQIPSMSVTE